MKRRFLNFESAYLKLKNFSLLINQLVFFTMCERLLMQQQKLTSLYTLMFFNVIIYCVAYVKVMFPKSSCFPSCYKLSV
ncbi:hypothetical protein E2C01_099796 [Portunus trituberculatus]|uniref:Uncharacterized protein n=1 Tax=Portunus trituberculatus TaxID=210409 RepID=A0A5B7KBM7_PORTR|nr:hypothetical protein [Portunus trituberculatus]